MLDLSLFDEIGRESPLQKHFKQPVGVLTFAGRRAVSGLGVDVVDATSTLIHPTFDTIYCPAPGFHKQVGIGLFLCGIPLGGEMGIPAPGGIKGTGGAMP